MLHLGRPLSRPVGEARLAGTRCPSQPRLVSLSPDRGAPELYISRYHRPGEPRDARAMPEAIMRLATPYAASTMHPASRPYAVPLPYLITLNQTYISPTQTRPRPDAQRQDAYISRYIPYAGTVRSVYSYGSPRCTTRPGPSITTALKGLSESPRLPGATHPESSRGLASRPLSPGSGRPGRRHGLPIAKSWLAVTAVVLRVRRQSPPPPRGTRHRVGRLTRAQRSCHAPPAVPSDFS